METINSILLWLGDTARGAGEAIAEFFAGVFGWIAWALNPVMSPVLAFLNPICTKVGDVVFGLLGNFPPWFGITAISIVLGVVMLFAFRHTSNQAAIARAKDDIKANLLAMKLFKDELHVTFRSQRRILWALLRLQRYILVPVLILAFPMMLCIAQMAIRYQWRPVAPGERVVLKIHVAPDTVKTLAATLDAPGGVQNEIGPIAGKADIAWRLRGVERGRYTLSITVGGQRSVKEIVVGEPLSRVSAVRPGTNWIDQLLHPVESRIDNAASGVSSIEVDYPRGANSWIYGADSWLIYFFVVSMISALIFAPVFRVRF